MQQASVLLLLVVVAVASSMVAIVRQDKDKFREVKQINPIMRYWANSRLRRKLPILETRAATNKKKIQEGDNSLKYRNCFFSPVQCQLPVTIEKDPLVSALKIEPQPNFLRFRRFP